MDPGGYWDAVLDGWADTPGHRALRAYSDAVNIALVEAWLPPHVGRLLKTDVFDEAVGAGLVPALSMRAETVVAVDVSSSTIARTRLRYPELEVECADVRQLPFADASFDAVVSNSTLDHFGGAADIAAALRELHRLLVPGGVLVVTLDNPANPLVALRNALPFGPLHRIGLLPYRPGATIGPRRLRELLRAAGFEVTALTAVMHVPRVVAAAAARLRRHDAGTLLRAEGLERLPTRYLSGQFTAARARKLSR